MDDTSRLGNLLATTPEGRARAAAFADFEAPPGPMEWVEYKSSGRLLIVGPVDEAWPVAERLKADLDCLVLSTRPPAELPETPPPVKTVDGRPRELEGYLGAFTLKVEVERGRVLEAGPALGVDPPVFDLVLDLDGSADPGVDEPPPGYFRGDNEARRQRALEELPHMVGEFQKPRYFSYDASICAHGERGITGCTKCIDACATGAALSVGETVEVNPYLCQGCGSCVTVCPSGAMRYTAPRADDLLDSLRRLIAGYREHAGSPVETPEVLLYSADSAIDTLEAAIPGLPERMLPVAVEDAGSVGADIWLTLLAYGAGRVVLLTGPEPAPSLISATRRQIKFYRRILEGLGDPRAAERVVLWEGEAAAASVAEALAPHAARPATFAALGTKREIICQALEHLHAHAGAPAESVALPADAPFGTVHVDRDACTLCMACVSVCPASALQGGGEFPRLNFREDRCVQCGLCETACPEDAIGLEARMVFAAHLEPAERVLNEEEMHHCPDCGKPFATRQMIDRMAERLAGHWMYQDADARARLWLCEDCRIKQLWDDDGGMQLDPRKGP